MSSAPPLDPRWDAAMTRALVEADAAAADGDVPVGAVMVSPDGALVVGRNLREVDEDPTAHAEVVAIRAAARKTGRWRLDGWTCVVTLEPCPMCAGALVNARIARVVFGCRDPKAGAVRSLFEITTDLRLNHRLEVVEGVMAEACAQRLKSFFAARRSPRAAG
jgi:tRNA(adenine34) deaminase